MDILGLHIELSSTHRKRIRWMHVMRAHLNNTIAFSPEKDVKDSNIWTNTRKLIISCLENFNKEYPYF